MLKIQEEHKMTEFELLIDFYKDGKRQGPGSTSETLKALNFIDFDKDKLEQAEPLKIADIGCGSGAQTMVLAQNTDAEITAVDLFPEILTKLNIAFSLANEYLSKKPNIENVPISEDAKEA